MDQAYCFAKYTGFWHLC